MKKYLLFAVVCLILMCSGCTHDSSAGVKSDGNITGTNNIPAADTDSIDDPAQEYSVMSYEKLMDSYTDKTDETSYPDYYGGSYIDDEGNYNVYIKGNAAQTKNVSREIEKIIGSSDFVIKEATYSYNELESVMDTLNTYQQNYDNEVSRNFLVYYLSDRNNEVVVELNNMGAEQIRLFKENVLDSPCITFVKSEGVVYPE
jgi:streptogrisin B